MKMNIQLLIHHSLYQEYPSLIEVMIYYEFFIIILLCQIMWINLLVNIKHFYQLNLMTQKLMIYSIQINFLSFLFYFSFTFKNLILILMYYFLIKQKIDQKKMEIVKKTMEIWFKMFILMKLIITMAIIFKYYLLGMFYHNEINVNIIMNAHDYVENSTLIKK